MFERLITAIHNGRRRRHRRFRIPALFDIRCGLRDHWILQPAADFLAPLGSSPPHLIERLPDSLCRVPSFALAVSRRGSLRVCLLRC
jgi:hypothetical protein